MNNYLNKYDSTAKRGCFLYTNDILEMRPSLSFFHSICVHMSASLSFSKTERTLKFYLVLQQVVDNQFIILNTNLIKLSKVPI